MDNAKWQRWASWAEKNFGGDRAKVAAALAAVEEAHKRGEDGATAVRRAETAAASVRGADRGGAWGSAAPSLPRHEEAGGGGGWAATWNRAPAGRRAPQPAVHGTAPVGQRGTGGRKGVRTASYAGLGLGALLLLAGSPLGVLFVLFAAAGLVYARGH